MTNMYVVYLTHYLGEKLPEWYVGHTTEKRILEGYNGSPCSKKYGGIYEHEQKNNKDLFRTRILSYHKTRLEASKEEYRVQKKHLVVTNPKYFNEAYAAKDGCFTRDKHGALNPMFGKGHLLRGNKNGRHRNNYKGNIKDISKKLSKSLRKTDKNKHNNNSSSKKYYVCHVPTMTFTDIDKGHLNSFCNVFGIGYTTLLGTLKTNHPIPKTKRLKYKNSYGYQLFYGS